MQKGYKVLDDIHSLHHKIIRNGIEINNDGVLRAVNRLIFHRLHLDTITRDSYNIRHMSCILFGISKWREKVTNWGKFSS